MAMNDAIRSSSWRKPTVALRLVWVFAALSLLTAASDLRGQGNIALHGVVEDETGIGIAGARLTLLATTTTLTRKANADKTGQFGFDDLPAGTYVLHAEAVEFQSVDVPVSVGSSPLEPLRITLRVGLAEEVTVTGTRGEEPVLQDKNGDQVKIDNDLLRELPTDGTDVLALASSFLSPASIGGEHASIVVDGIEGGAGPIPTTGIRRMLINRNPYSAEYRRPGTARIEIITEHGSSSHVRGSAALFVRNSALDARNAFAPSKSPLDRRWFEGMVSGPLPGNRASFFLSGDGLTSKGAAIVNARTLGGPVAENVPNREANQRLLGRLDWHPSEVQTVLLRYGFSRESGTNRGVGGLRLREQGFATSAADHQFQLTDQNAWSSLLNHLRLWVERSFEHRGTAASGPAVLVHGAFTGGPSQTDQTDQSLLLQAQDVASVFGGPHTIRFGANLRRRWIEMTDASDFAGTFEFASLDRLAAGTPSVFRVNQGQPALRFPETELFGFVQDEVLLRPTLSLMLGGRYDRQSWLHDSGAFAPRAALAFSPGKAKTVLRAGAGLFHGRLPEGAVRRELLLDGARVREVVVTEPSYPDPFFVGNVQMVLPSIVRIAPDIAAPSSIQASIGVEREVWQRTQVVVEYQAIRGSHLFRSRNINLPAVETGLRPDARFLNIDRVESSATLRGQSLGVTWRGRVTRRFKGTAQYALSRTRDDSSGPFALPAYDRDLSAEVGRADSDRRHRFTLAGTLTFTSTIRVGAIAKLASGAPFDITTGFDNNGDTVANDRPPGVTRNTGQGPGLAQLDLRVTKLLSVWRPFDYPDRSHEVMTINLDLFNVLNRTNATTFVGVLSSPLFGRSVSAGPARTVQLSVRYRF
ncbi:MAG: hypothetical protein DMF95_08905 [Acidobacteria bacterium]|nr:MAG: hypothetical protein DMF95_08905 [Acidobacteriota bacterium]